MGTVMHSISLYGNSMLCRERDEDLHENDGYEKKEGAQDVSEMRKIRHSIRKIWKRRRKWKQKIKNGKIRKEKKGAMTELKLDFHNIRGYMRKDQEVMERMVREKIDILMLEETKKKWDDEPYKERGYRYYEVRATNKEGERGSRGGLLCMVRDILSERVIEIKAETNIQWIKVCTGQKRTQTTGDIFVCNVYIPPDRDREGRERRAEILGDLTKDVRELRKRGMIVIGGDMNARMSVNGDEMTNAEGEALEIWAAANELVIVNKDEQICKGKYTREQEIQCEDGSCHIQRSTLDYVLVSAECYHHVSSLTICNDKLGSDHKPISLSLTNLHLLRSPTSSSSLPAQININNVEDYDKQVYSRALRREMEKFREEYESMKDDEDAKAKVELELALLRRALLQAGSEAFGAKPPANAPSQAYLSAETKQVLEERNEMMERMISAHERGEPREELMTWMNEYREIKKRAKKMVKKDKKKVRVKMYERMEETKDMRVYWKLMDILRNKKKKSQMPVLTDKDGTIYSDTSSKLDYVRRYNLELGKEDEKIVIEERKKRNDEDECIEHEHKSKNDEEREKISEAATFHTKVEEKLKEMMKEMKENEELDKDFTMKELRTAIKSLKTGKACGADNVKGELIKWACDEFQLALLIVFNDVLRAEVWPEQWELGIIGPLFKGGTQSDLDDYRNITLLSVLAKLFECMLNARLMAWSEKVKLLHDEQAGFRQKRSTLDQVFLLNEIWTSRKEAGEPTVSAFIDVRKAYDRVWRNGLFVKLFEMGVNGRVWRLVRNMYSCVRRRVRVNEELTDEFRIDVGVAQGSVLSPFLYSCFINAVADELKQRGLGVDIAGERVALLLYADDIVLTMARPGDMKTALSILDDYARKWKFKYNARKSNIVVYGTQSQRDRWSRQSWKLAGEKLLVVREYKYLGIEMGNERARWSSVVKRKLTTAEMQMRILVHSGCKQGHLRPRSSVQAWKTLVRPILEYGLEIIKCTKAEMQQMERIQNYIGRRILGVPECTSATFVRNELGLETIAARQEMLQLRWWWRLANADTERLMYKVFTHRCEQVRTMRQRKEKGRDSCCVALRDVMVKHGFEAEWNDPTLLIGVTQEEWNTRVDAACSEEAKAVTREGIERGRGRMHKDVDRIMSEEPMFKDYLDEVSRSEGTRLKTLLRANALQLMGVIGKWSGQQWPESLQRCWLCATEEEDATHFVARCPAFAAERTTFVSIVRQRIHEEMMDRQLEWTEAQTISDIVLSSQAIKMNENTARSVNKTSRNYLCAIWRKRNELFGGEPKIVNKELIFVRDK